VVASAWAKWRAGLIALAIVFTLIDGCPVPSDENLKRWPERWVQYGIRLRETRALLLTPIAGVTEFFDVRQRWKLFSAARIERTWMYVEARRSRKAWQLLYRPHDPQANYASSLLQYRRIRGAWNVHRPDPGPGYPAFVDAIARRIFLDPNLRYDEVRVRMARIRVLPGRAAFEETGEFLHEERRQRRSLLP